MLIFQYGSNCLDKEMNGPHRLCGDAEFVSIAHTVEDYQLEFCVYSERRKCAASSLTKKPGAKAWGALYQVPDWLITRDTAKAEGRLSLDAIEGEGSNYERQSIAVVRPDGVVEEAVTYVAKNPLPSIPTSNEYVGFVVDGLRERGVPEEYVETVIEQARRNNPGLQI